MVAVLFIDTSWASLPKESSVLGDIAQSNTTYHTIRAREKIL
jgi:hypothetical protein